MWTGSFDLRRCAVLSPPSPYRRWLARTPLSPDVVTLFGVALQGLIAYLIIDGHLLWAGLMGIPAGFADALLMGRNRHI